MGVFDLRVGIEVLGGQGVERKVFVGWFFEGAVVISAGAVKFVGAYWTGYLN